MPCDHVGPPEIIEMAEADLLKRAISRDRWPGMRARHGENLPEGSMWASVVIEIERRDDQWIVTRLDRNRDPISPEETGLRFLT